jgi:hypothetical protein
MRGKHELDLFSMSIPVLGHVGMTQNWAKGILYFYSGIDN